MNNTEKMRQPQRTIFSSLDKNVAVYKSLFFLTWIMYRNT